MEKAAKKSHRKSMQHARRKHRVNTIIKATASHPRLLVRRTLSHIYVQLIDLTGHVLATASDATMKEGTKSEKAYKVGELIAEAALKANVKDVVFDRNGYLYHGRVKQLAEGARAGGLVF